MRKWYNINMLNKSKDGKSAASYYQKLGSRLGYLLVMKRSQHFGYYDDQHTTEDKAQTNYHSKFIKLLRLHPNMRILDAGCGQGVVATEIAKTCKVKVTGITITPHEVKNAARRALRHGVAARTSFLVQDYSDLSFDDSSFDRIYTTESLSHARNVKQVLSECYRVLKPGGMLVCAEYEMDYKNFNQEIKRLADLVKDHAAIHAMYQFGRGEFEQSIKETGFELMEVQDWTTGLKPSFDRLRRLARPLAGIIKKLRLEHLFVNVTAASLYSDGVENNVFAYKVYICKKPL